LFGLQGFKLHRNLVDGTVKSVWFRQVFSLLSVQFKAGFTVDLKYCDICCDHYVDLDLYI